jgi:hypothetical protein
MAELAVPIIVLGSLYILSEQEKKKEKFIGNNVNVQEGQKKNTNTQEGYTNYNPVKLQTFETQKNDLVNSYNNSNQYSDKYFMQQNGNVLSQEKEVNNINLMSGQQMDMNQFKHNNMQPYFGAKIRGNTADINLSESILDNKQGTGSQLNNKSEQAPLFKPDGNMNHAYGTPNNSDFFQSRMNESMKMSNITLWEPQKVAPGLNLGYGSQDEKGFNTGGTEGNGGFNAGMVSRDTWMPKTVDELRVDTNPKLEFDLNGHQGPAISHIKTQGPNDKIGKVEKHLPEKYYDSGPQRWFTTTGQEKNPPIRSTQVMPMENRIDTTREYYGASANTEAHATYANQEFEESKKLNLGQLPISNASAANQNHASQNDYSVQGYNLLPNNRTTDKNIEMGGIYGMAKAAMTPLLDILKPSRKENAIGNLRQTGNVNGTTPSGHVFNSYDKTKTTNREMTTGKIDMNYINVQAQNQRGNIKQVGQYQAVQNQRDTTNQEYIGSGSAQGAGLRTYNAAYAQENNVNKTYELRTNQGNMALFNNHNQMQINRDERIMQNNRGQVANGGPNIIPSTEFMGEVNGIQTYDNTLNNSRMDESLLSAFKNNPYTKSLSSVA